ncbi:MAG: NHL repeat-containing protein [Bacteroidetes bacterium]|nr:NHL repeat-containing protein [Bacteroidota bacterium]MCH8942728.1 NHL repeat-containing protein [Bacteroidota bacterium]
MKTNNIKIFPTFILLIILSYPSGKLFPQNYNLLTSFGNFQNAETFSINSKGIIYVVDSETNEIFALDTLGNELNHTGGFGWDVSAFDQPIDIFATSLNVYVTDKYNHRIQRLDNDLNFISELVTRNKGNEEDSFGYPLSAATSSLGELYVLDSENIRIIKFNIFGRFISNFGSYNYGMYALKDPTKLAISKNNDVYVLDGNKLIRFDQYGNGNNIRKLNKNFTNIRIYNDNMLLNSKDEIYLLNLNTPDSFLSKLFLFGTALNYPIKATVIFNNKLYVLTEEEISVFTKN